MSSRQLVQSIEKRVSQMLQYKFTRFGSGKGGNVSREVGWANWAVVQGPPQLRGLHEKQ